MLPAPTSAPSMIEHEVRGTTHLLSLCHGKVSALDLELIQALTASFHAFGDSDGRALVLTGRGTAFCGGADLRRLIAEDARYIDAFLGELVIMLREMLNLERPVIAAINGHAIAGGCILAAACDRRLMAEGRGRIGVTELFVGVPFPPLALELLVANYTPAVLRTLVYEGGLFSPTEAVAMGIVDGLIPPDQLLDAALELAARLGGIVPETFAVTKAQLNQRIIRRTDEELPALVERGRVVWHSDPARAVMREFFARATGQR
jgi:enoyl-CoA hydratase